MCLNQGFSEEKWNGNKKDRWSNDSKRLDCLVFLFSFSHLITTLEIQNKGWESACGLIR